MGIHVRWTWCPKHYSKTRPKPSQLTQSAFWSAVYGVQEDHDYTPSFDDLEGERDTIADELQNILDEEQSKLDNMPDNLRDGDTGQTIQERIDALESAINDLQSVDISFEEDMEGIPEDKREEETQLRKDERTDEIWGEILGYLDIGCS